MSKLPWMETAISLIGLKEYPGNADNPEIIDWAKNIGGWTKDFYKKDSIPWCGLFAGHCMAENGITPPKELLRALAWAGFGEKVEPAFGAVMVFKRNGGGHVGFYVSEDKTTYHILGGNQSDMVNISRIEKNRFVAARWPKELMRLYKPGRIVKQFNGKISKNEQ